MSEKLTFSKSVSEDKHGCYRLFSIFLLWSLIKFLDGTTLCLAREFNSLSELSIRHRNVQQKTTSGLLLHLGNTVLNWTNLRQSQFIVKTCPPHWEPLQCGLGCLTKMVETFFCFPHRREDTCNENMSKLDQEEDNGRGQPCSATPQASQNSVDAVKRGIHTQPMTMIWI